MCTCRGVRASGVITQASTQTCLVRAAAMWIGRLGADLRGGDRGLGAFPAGGPVVDVAAAGADERERHVQRGQHLTAGGSGEHGRGVVGVGGEPPVRRPACVGPQLAQLLGKLGEHAGARVERALRSAHLAPRRLIQLISSCTGPASPQGQTYPALTIGPGSPLSQFSLGRDWYNRFGHGDLGYEKWTHTNGAVAVSTATWSFTGLVSGGCYRTDAFVPDNFANNTRANYRVGNATGGLIATVNQATTTGWTTLGTVTAGSDRRINVTLDDTGPRPQHVHRRRRRPPHQDLLTLGHVRSVVPVSAELPGGIELSAAEVEALDARWASCWAPSQVADRLAGLAVPWYVAGGWAVELFLGVRLREHGDIEIAIPAAGWNAVRDRFPGYAFDAVGSGRIWTDPTPPVLAAVHQTWLRDPATGNYLLDVFREPHDADTWICRRDTTIRRPYRDIICHTQDGIPYLAPELVLLFKAKAARPKDQTDFDATAPRLNTAQRATLTDLLARTHPGHRWLADL